MIPKTLAIKAQKVCIYAIPGLMSDTKIPALNRPELQKDRIKEIVCTHYGLDPATILLSKSRKREMVFARQLIMYFMKKYTGMSLKSIGREFAGTSTGNKKDHTTVIHSIQTVKNLMDTDQYILQQVNQIDLKLM